ncbi:putative ATP-dependent RNA helicase, DEAD boxfamily [Moritella sp. PE36]|uniref:DEAD/DEAH box helicase n=1 Tax=Moritella sp. PE36 TaxID=58051 RepID=UPI0001569C68|nr:DEAD/DEAH box helicase [Moritella sp. PE36]EDM66039.1 putative ATP-dependent RNA helicase, DEAD boxfamily [Moritella sp. PE36]
MGFSALNLNQNLINTVTKLGYETPTPIQAQAIPAILEGRDIMGGAQTGTGKTAAFALPIIHQLMAEQLTANATEPTAKKQIRALILTPTRELSQQVHKSFVTYSEDSELTSELVYGGVSINPQVKALVQGADILVATPGRLLDLLDRETLTLEFVEKIVFDEADRMLDMGFMEEIRRILKHLPKKRQTMLFSATFDDAIFKLSKSLLNDPLLVEVDTRNAAAEQVEQIVYAVDNDRKRELTSYLIGSRNWHQVLIFTRTKQGADSLAKEMCKDGIKTIAVHGDKSQGARERGLEDFKNGKVRALVATDVAARGLDIEQLKHVINFELPFKAEDYIHRIGRTGRAGLSGTATSLVSIGENWLLEEIETLLDTRLVAQWLPGYEPDLSKPVDDGRGKGGGKGNGRTDDKRRAKNRSYGKKTNNRAKKDTKPSR